MNEKRAIEMRQHALDQSRHGRAHLAERQVALNEQIDKLKSPYRDEQLTIDEVLDIQAEINSLTAAIDRITGNIAQHDAIAASINALI